MLLRVFFHLNKTFENLMVGGGRKLRFVYISKSIYEKKHLKNYAGRVKHLGKITSFIPFQTFSRLNSGFVYPFSNSLCSGFLPTLWILLSPSLGKPIKFVLTSTLLPRPAGRSFPPAAGISSLRPSASCSHGTAGKNSKLSLLLTKIIAILRKKRLYPQKYIFQSCLR